MSKRKHKDKYHKLPHGCDKKTLLHTDGRKYKRSRRADENDEHDWYVEHRKHPGLWRQLACFANDNDKDYFLALDLESAWVKKFESKSNSDSKSASADEQPQTDVHYSKFGLDKQGREKFETVKLKDGKRLYFSANLKEAKDKKSKLHWLRYFMRGQDSLFGFDEETTSRFIKRMLVGLSQKLLLKASEYARDLYDERNRKAKRP